MLPFLYEILEKVESSVDIQRQSRDGPSHQPPADGFPILPQSGWKSTFNSLSPTLNSFPFTSSHNNISST
jgi:hypothetical protein